MWTEKAHQRFKERIQAITSRSWGVSTFCMLRELRRYVVGWLNYFGISQEWPLDKVSIFAGSAFPAAVAVGDFNEATARLIE